MCRTNGLNMVSCVSQWTLATWLNKWHLSCHKVNETRHDLKNQQMNSLMKNILPSQCFLDDRIVLCMSCTLMVGWK